jgi:hypothetical protein
MRFIYFAMHKIYCTMLCPSTHDHNRNSFSDQICPNGTEVHMNALAKQPSVCNPADAEACPPGYGCALSKFMRTFYCCATNRPTTVLVEPPPPSTSQLLNTMEGNVNKQSRSLNLKILDPFAESTPECPSDRRPFLYPRTTKPLQCVQPTSKCPPHFACILSTNSNLYLCCSEKTQGSGGQLS